MKNSLFHNLAVLLLNSIVGALLAFAFGFNPLLGALYVNLLMVGFALIKVFITGKPLMAAGNLFSGLLTEFWLSAIMEKFYPDGSFLTAGTNMSAFVEYNQINLADAGVDPDVYINNTTYPLPITERADGALAIPLDYFDTANTVVRNARLVELAYDKMASVVRGHRMSLYKKNIQKAGHAYGPASDTAKTPVIQLANANASIIDAIIDGQARLDALDAPLDRVLVLCPAHKAKIKKEDKVLFKDVFGPNGSKDLYGFQVYDTTVTPKYNKTTATKNVFGAAPAATDVNSSLFYVASEVMYADGSYDMFARLKDPEARGDIIGFQKRFVALPIRNTAIGAIIDPAA
jgi:hypothetical protein